jgi:hypothetical protein
LRAQLDLFGWSWVFISEVSPTSSGEDDEDEFSGRQVQDTSTHHERVGFQAKPYEIEGEFQW